MVESYNVHSKVIFEMCWCGITGKVFIVSVGKLRGGNANTVKSLAFKNVCQTGRPTQCQVYLKFIDSFRCLCTKLPCVRSKGPTENKRG